MLRNFRATFAYLPVNPPTQIGLSTHIQYLEGPQGQALHKGFVGVDRKQLTTVDAACNSWAVSQSRRGDSS